MANTLEKFYNRFAGVDSRSNKLLQDPGTFRKGSKNMRYNFQDELQNAQGFQHRDDASSACAAGSIEYKYTNLETGESTTELLGVGTDGILRRKKFNALKFTNVGTAAYYSFYYSGTGTTFYLDLFNSSEVVISTFTVTTTTTLAQLSTSLNAAGYTTIVVNDLGATVIGSAKKAYLGKCTIKADLAAGDSTVSSWYWEQVPTPNSSGVAFPVTVSNFGDSNYQGISYTNLNNCCYITDGGFPMKYDGKAVFRAGMPRVLPPSGATGITGPYNFSGQSIRGATTTGAGLTTTCLYAYKFRYGFINYSGEEILGTLDANIFTGKDYLETTLVGGQNSIIIGTYGLNTTNGQEFPVFACQVNGAQNIPSAGGTFNVDSGHNILAGMSLRIPISNAGLPTPLSGYSFIIARVSSVTSTSITVEIGKTGGLNPASATDLLIDNQVLNGYWRDPIFENTITDVFPTPSSRLYHPETVCGAFIRVYRCKANVPNGPFYEVADIPIPLPGQYTEYTDTLADTNLITEYVVDDGYELPRACKYLQAYQNQLIQGGRPLNVDKIDTYYPSYYGTVPLVGAWGYSTVYKSAYAYTEINFCDYQSFYWNDVLTTEGFPNDGTHEMRVDTIFNDVITGMYPNKEALFVFKTRSTSIHTGILATNDLNSEILEGDTGCVGQRTIQEVDGYLLWLDEKKGFYSCVAGRLPVHVGYPIDDYQKINAEKLDYNTAVSANHRAQNLYFCFVGSTWFVFDHAEAANGSERNCWYIWDRFPVTSCLATANNELLAFDSTRTWEAKFTGSVYDYSDHTSAIDFKVLTAWWSLGMPIIDKHFVALWINSIQGDFELDVTQYGNFIDTVIATQNNVAFPAETVTKKAIKEQIKASLPKLSSISFGLGNNTVNSWVRVQGYEMQYSPDFTTGEPKR